jgi:hypothetical protein
MGFHRSILGARWIAYEMYDVDDTITSLDSGNDWLQMSPDCSRIMPVILWDCAEWCLTSSLFSCSWSYFFCFSEMFSSYVACAAFHALLLMRLASGSSCRVHVSFACIARKFASSVFVCDDIFAVFPLLTRAWLKFTWKPPSYTLLVNVGLMSKQVTWVANYTCHWLLRL